MNRTIRSLLALSVATLLAGGPVLSRAEPVAKPVADYTVFVDPPTGFVFVKLPAGWKFTGKVEQADLATLPRHVVTALLVGRYDDESTTVAAKPGATVVRR